MKLMFITLAAHLFQPFHSPDKGGDTGDDEATEKETEAPKSVEEIAEENQQLVADFEAMDPPVKLPDFPGTPTGLERARQFMRDALKAREDGTDGANPPEGNNELPEEGEGEDIEEDTAESLVEKNSRDELLALAENEEVEVDTRASKAEIAEAIIAKRNSGE